MECPAQSALDKIFPPERSDQFFEAIYGGAEDGAYDITLCCQKVEEDRALMAFKLSQRPGKCLACSLTYGLPQVFQRHPIINLAGVASALGELLGWGANVEWEVGPVREESQDLHIIPFTVKPA